MKIPKPVAGALVMALCVAAVLISKAFLFRETASAAQVVTTPTADPRHKGPLDAMVKIIEFTDFQCPACARATEKLQAAFIQHPGKISLQLKYFPLAMHSFARRAAVYAECASAQGKFWPFHDGLYKSQSSWAKMAAVDPYFSELGVSLGLDGVRLSACVNNPATLATVAKDVEEGSKRGINSTPTFFINGKMVVGGKALTDELDSIFKANAK